MSIIARFLTELVNLWKYADARTFRTYLLQLIRTTPQVVWSRNLKSADKGMRGTPCRFKVSEKAHVTTDGVFFGVERELYVKRAYFAVPGFAIEEGDLVIDLGAYVGTFTTLAALCGRKVIDVEPEIECLRRIEANLRMNHVLEKASIEHGFMGSSSETLCERKKRARDLIESRTGTTVSILSMPSIMQRHRVDQVSFLKVDIEGSEFNLFSEDTSWLSNVKRLAMEVHPNHGDVDQLVSTIKKHDFSVWKVDNTQRIVQHQEYAYLFAERNGRRSGVF